MSWDSSKVDGKVTEKVQQGILAALNRASPQDEALFTMMDLVCLENVPPSKWRTKRFTRHLAAGGVSVGTFIETMLHLSYIIEEKITAEMKDKMGCIMHDG